MRASRHHARLVMTPQPPTVADLLADLSSGRREAAAIGRECLARIDEKESEIRAWVTIDRAAARAAAEALDADRTAGTPVGPLVGMPVGVKDIADVARMPTAAGFLPWSDRMAAE